MLEIGDDGVITVSPVQNVPTYQANSKDKKEERGAESEESDCDREYNNESIIKDPCDHVEDEPG